MVIVHQMHVCALTEALIWQLESNPITTGSWHLINICWLKLFRTHPAKSCWCRMTCTAHLNYFKLTLIVTVNVLLRSLCRMIMVMVVLLLRNLLMTMWCFSDCNVSSVAAANSVIITVVVLQVQWPKAKKEILSPKPSAMLHDSGPKEIVAMCVCMHALVCVCSHQCFIHYCSTFITACRPDRMIIMHHTTIICFIKTSFFLPTSCHFISPMSRLSLSQYGWEHMRMMVKYSFFPYVWMYATFSFSFLLTITRETVSL